MTMMPNANEVQSAGQWPAQSRALVCRAFLRVEKIILESLGPQLSARHYVALLFEVYLAEIEGKTLYQACLSTDEIVSKPHRRSARLAALGALIRRPNPQDQRRTDLQLTWDSRSALDRIIDTMATLSVDFAATIRQSMGADANLLPSLPSWYHMPISTRSGTMGMNIARGKVIAGGRIALPAEMRRALGLQNGDTVLFELEGDEVRIRPAKSALRRVQERLRAFAPKDGLVSEELIAERRVEAARD
ncbi:AbrB/MazE/SpoVT family DNA-binding domain-containing protein [Novosphingobium sp. KACC 22771]|uniref:AbrB/MazE/SpoVT family DNA-binding domain-containing protein n=1 Tax=Novosphingobium sp. KACC 22771 TaxID=3025670 RepID=UPI002365D1C8|nr:AbrB/MazE/SpoVT family DNA-binding domain-containing protein [Novosphingobium sp. KACC 22771]WDF74215.1 AbrB/MazE/SpoVT family DNA-binding domain-containing protein [Novosphingobium sp. KACC 22771]